METSFKGSQFTDILDVMHDTGFIGLRLTQFPQILETYGITQQQMERRSLQAGLAGGDHLVQRSGAGRVQQQGRFGQRARRP